MKEKIRTVEVHIAVGLPGSGKTTWMKAKSEEVKYPEGYSENSCIRNQVYESWYIDIDYTLGSTTHRDSVISNGKLDVKRLLSYSTCLSTSWIHEDPIYVWIDGLALNTDDVLYYMRGLSDMVDPIKQMYIGGPAPFKWNIVVDQWKCDREQCVINDKLRLGTRLMASNVTIQNAEYRMISEEELMKAVLDESLNINDVKVVYHDVYKVEDWQIALDRHGDEDIARYMYSPEWCLGGTWGNYLGSRGTVDADSPLENTVLDELLEEICPNITYLQYKKLKDRCVTLKEKEESDYYGGSTRYASWRTDLKVLYETLTSWGYSINTAKKKKKQ